MIVCGGENLIDMIEQPEAAGARAFRAHIGGSPYNCSRAIARLGSAAGYLGAISTDNFGTQLLEKLEADGVRFLGQRCAAPTSLAMVTVSDGQPDYRFYRESTAERAVDLESLRAALPDEMQALHVSSIALVEGADAQAWASLFCEVSQGGCLVTLDPNVRALIAEPNRETYSARLQCMARAAHLIRLSDEDAAWWFPGLSSQEALEGLATIAPQSVILLTQGPRPVLCHAPAGGFTVKPVLPAQLADTVGAGDTLMAAVLVGLTQLGALTPAALAGLAQDRLRAIVACATEAAALTCSRPGCNPPMAEELWQGR